MTSSVELSGDGRSLLSIDTSLFLSRIIISPNVFDVKQLLHTSIVL